MNQLFENPTGKTDHGGNRAAGEPRSCCSWCQPTARGPRRRSEGSTHILRGTLGPPTRACRAGLRGWFLWTRCGHGGAGRGCGVETPPRKSRSAVGRRLAQQGRCLRGDHGEFQGKQPRHTGLHVRGREAASAPGPVRSPHRPPKLLPRCRKWAANRELEEK